MDKVEVVRSNVVRSNQVRRAKLFLSTRARLHACAKWSVRWLLLPVPAKSKPANPRDFPQF
jgi:hypothetical protein